MTVEQLDQYAELKAKTEPLTKEEQAVLSALVSFGSREGDAAISQTPPNAAFVEAEDVLEDAQEALNKAS